MTARSLASIAALLLLSSAFAGCLDRSADEPAAQPAPATGDEAAATDAAGIANVTDDGSMEGNVTLGEMPHLHDYWDGRERVTLLDEDIAVDPFTGAFFTFFNVLAAKRPAVGGTFVTLPDGAIVYEGTGQLELTASWQDPAVTGLDVTFTTPASPDWTELNPLTSGTAFAVPVTPEMCDMPHAKTTRWQFVFVPPQGAVAMGTFHLKVDIVKMRDISKFPGHPDLFGDATEKQILDADAKTAQQGVAGQITAAATADGPRWRPEGGVAPTELVPMETMELRIDVTITSATSQVGTVGNVWLLYKTADRNWFEVAEALEGDAASGKLTYAIPVDMRQTDSPYAEASQWLFDLRVSNDAADGVQFCGACFDAQIDYHITVTAFDHNVLAQPEEDEEGGDDGGARATTPSALPALRLAASGAR